MLIEEGFKVVSIDDSEKMLKYALRIREKKKYDDWSKSYVTIFMVLAVNP